jgi:hypothetical protein
MILQPLRIRPSRCKDGCFEFDIARTYKGRLWLDTGGEEIIRLNNDMIFHLGYGDTVKIPENIGCPIDALSPGGA